MLVPHGLPKRTQVKMLCDSTYKSGAFIQFDESKQDGIAMKSTTGRNPPGPQFSQLGFAVATRSRKSGPRSTTAPPANGAFGHGYL